MEAITPEQFWEAMEIFEKETGAVLSFSSIMFQDDYCRGDSKLGIPFVAHFTNVLNRVMAGDTEPAFTFPEHPHGKRPATTPTT